MGLLMPVGGEAVWGNSTWSPEGEGLGAVLSFTTPPQEKVCVNDESNMCDATSFEKNVTKLTSESICSINSELGEREDMTGRDKQMLQQVERAGISEERRKHVSVVTCYN